MGKHILNVKEAGKLGGLSLLQKRGNKYFSEIGLRGQQRMRDKYPGKASEWGKKGGRPRKPTWEG